MGKIKLLNEEVTNKIAAGEVIERPASVVKELVENAIDADATRIQVKVKNGGKDSIQVIDNGSGIAAEEVELAFERHATSKIEEANDLFALRTLGFRGEALPSIAAVSRIEVTTKPEDSLSGTKVQVEGGEIVEKSSCGCAQGTNIIVEDLFFNTPVRYKYLKQTATEMGHITDIINRLSLAYPEISFTLRHNGRQVLETNGNGKLRDVIFNIYGRQAAQEMIEVDYQEEHMHLEGYISKPSVTRSSRKYQSFFVNDRFIKSGLMGKAVSEAYHTLLTVDRYPIVVLKLNLNPILVDVNVHPTKLEAKFSRGNIVYELVENGVQQALKNSDLVPEMKLLAAEEEETINNEAQQTELQLTNKSNKTKQSTADSGQDKKKISADSSSDYQPSSSDQNSKEVRAQKIDALLGVENSPEENNKDEPAVAEEAEDYQTEKGLIPLGQIHQTYIVAQGLDGMYIVDQHAAHERIRYQQLLAEYQQQELEVQELLVPLKLDLIPPELELLQDRQDKLAELGFELEHFGGQTYLVRGVPTQLHNLDNKQLIRDSIEQLLAEEATESYQLVEKFITMLSCKTAIKGGDKLSTEEMRHLLEQIDEYEVTNCPHGRPVMMHISKQELAKKFKRQ